MLFQSLDYKRRCRAFYCNGEIYERFDPAIMTETWMPSAHLQDYDIKYANLYCAGLSIDEICPDHLKGQWQQLRDKKRAFIKSFPCFTLDLFLIKVSEPLSRRFNTSSALASPISLVNSELASLYPFIAGT